MTSARVRSLLAVLDTGFEPLGVVMGAVAFQIMRPGGCFGWSSTSADPVVYPTYEQALHDAWMAATSRLEAEATRLGGHGVVGVGVKQEWLQGTMLQLQLVGTAVRVKDAPALSRPFVSMLSMEETLKLLLRGFVPCGIAFGFSAVHVHSWGTSAFWQGRTFSNVELTSPTLGVQLARSRAEQSLRTTLQRTRAGGAVGAHIELSHQGESCGSGGQGLRLEGRMTATGVARFRDPAVPVAGVISLAGAT